MDNLKAAVLDFVNERGWINTMPSVVLEALQSKPEWRMITYDQVREALLALAKEGLIEQVEMFSSLPK